MHSFRMSDRVPKAVVTAVPFLLPSLCNPLLNEWKLQTLFLVSLLDAHLKESYLSLLMGDIWLEKVLRLLKGKGSSSEVDGPGIVDQFRNSIPYAVVPACSVACSASAAGFVSGKRPMSNRHLGSLVCSACVQTGQQSCVALYSG